MQFAFQKQKKCQYQITVFDIMKYYQSGRIFKANFKTVKKTMRINYQIQQIYKLPLNSELKNSHIHLQIWNFKNLDNLTFLQLHLKPKRQLFASLKETFYHRT